MANWSLPTLSSLYTAVISAISDRLDDAAKMFDSGSTSPTNLPTGTKRWNASSSKFEKWSGSAWSDLATTYAINISGAAESANNLGTGVALANIGLGGLSYSYLQNITITKRLLGRNTAGSGSCEEVTLSQLLDWVGTTAQGDILYRGSSGWERLAAGVSGQVLTTQGTGANPAWGTNYACRAWVVFNGTGTVAIIASGNVSSITDNDTGDYTINFTSAMPDANYCITQSARRMGSTGSTHDLCVAPTAPSTTAVRLEAHNQTGLMQDSSLCSVAIFR